MSKENNKEQEEQLKDQEQHEEIENASETNQDKETEDDSTSDDLPEDEKLQKELKEQKDRYLRLFAEFENYKRRTSKERVELFKTAGQEVMTAMLPVLDDFDRALIELRKSADKNLLEGIELIHSKLNETLRKEGLEVMSVKEGDKFDADLHEAVTQIPAPKKKLKGRIVDVIQKGYTLGDRIIRYPKVVTGA